MKMSSNCSNESMTAFVMPVGQGQFTPATLRTIVNRFPTGFNDAFYSQAQRAGTSAAASRIRRCAPLSMSANMDFNHSNNALEQDNHQGMAEPSSNATHNIQLNQAKSVQEKVASLLTVDADELRELRMRYKLLQTQLAQSLKEERYMDAAKVRDRLADLRKRDPMMRYEDLSKQLNDALKREDYGACASLRDEIREVQVRLPHFRLRGKWGGVYGASGVQTVQIEVEGNYLVATKLVGDSNVPAGQITFKADVSMDGLIEPKLGDKPDPIAVALNQFANLKVKQRFHGQGQIANPGFTRPQWVPGELIVFEDDIIAFVWKPLSFMVVFERTKEM